MKETIFPDNINTFLESEHVMTLSVCDGNVPWSCSLFYAWDRDNLRLIFVSEFDTKHISLMKTHNKVSGTIHNNEKRVLHICGVQFQGIVKQTDVFYKQTAKSLFFKKFPYARIMKLQFWVVDILCVKMTDSRQQFAQKTLWERNI